MANFARRLTQNIAGNFYVDETCIDCDTCRQLAPATFRDHGDQSSVYHQPQTPEETRRALMAIVACPTASIGTLDKQHIRQGIEAFPSPVAENIYYCGYTAESSFGAWSYLIVRPESEGGNVLVDSPRFANQLTKRIDALGGVRTMLLTHRDDVADHAAFAKRYGCARVMHAAD
ncbi:MAG TPA: ferredoxin, partial [Pyrinomonadaceae bacterium]|nr:ferredoxin [Pyrinomonadaceae bacterium]